MKHEYERTTIVIAFQIDANLFWKGEERFTVEGLERSFSSIQNEWAVCGLRFTCESLPRAR